MFWLVFILIILFAGFVQGVMGFGFAVVALALLPFWLTDVKQAIIVLTLSTPLPIAWAFWEHRQDVKWRALANCLAGAALGLVLGLYVFEHVSADLLTRGTGLVLIAVCIESMLRPRAETGVDHASDWGTRFAGIVSGFFAGSVGLPGPPLVVYLARVGWPPQHFRAFSLAFFSITSIWRCTGVIVMGQVGTVVAMMALVAVPLVWLGHYWGTRAFRRVAPGAFRQLVYLLLIVSATNMLLRGSSKPESGRHPPVAASADGQTLQAQGSQLLQTQ